VRLWEGGKDTASHVLAKCGYYAEERWNFWQQKKKKKKELNDPIGEISPKDILKVRVGKTLEL